MPTITLVPAIERSQAATGRLAVTHQKLGSGVRGHVSFGVPWFSSLPGKIATKVGRVTLGIALPSRFGKEYVGPSWETLAGDTKAASKFALIEKALVSSAAAYLDGDGGGGGSQVMRAVIYADSAGAPGALLGSSVSASIAAGQAAGWITFTFTTSVELPVGTYWLGLLRGATSNAARWAYATGTTNQDATNADVYADGAADPFGSPTLADVERSIYATYVALPAQGVVARTGGATVGGLLGSGVSVYSPGPDVFEKAGAGTSPRSAGGGKQLVGSARERSGAGVSERVARTTKAGIWQELAAAASARLGAGSRSGLGYEKAGVAGSERAAGAASQHFSAAQRITFSVYRAGPSFGVFRVVEGTFRTWLETTGSDAELVITGDYVPPTQEIAWLLEAETLGDKIVKVG